jgi:prevent-host-death family protein
MQDAKNKFSKVVDIALQGTPQVVTRRGVPVVVVVAAEQFNFLTSKDHADNGFAKFLLSIPCGPGNHDADGFGTDCGASAFGLRDIEF